MMNRHTKCEPFHYGCVFVKVKHVWYGFQWKQVKSKYIYNALLKKGKLTIISLYL